MKTFLLASLLMASAGSFAAEITVTADRAMRLYPLCSNAVVTVTVRENGALLRTGRVNVRVTNDGGTEKLAESAHDLQAANPFSLAVGMRKPGFAFVEATLEGTKTSGRANLGFEIERISAVRPEPADFDAWWAVQFAEQDRLKDAVTLKPVSDPAWDGRFDYFQLQIRTIAAEGRTTGFLGIPKKAQKKLPCFVIVQCAGCGYCAPEANFIREDMMTLTLNVHPWDTTAEGYRDFFKRDGKENGAYMYRGCDAREKSYFRNAVLGCKTAVDYVIGRSDCSGELFYFGASQGGGMGLALGGIFGERFTAMCIQVPALCDLFGSEAGRRDGWPGVGVRTKSREMDYYDAVNWARRIRSPLHFRVGMMDRTCPPSGPMAAYNAVPRSVPKFLSIGTDWVHGVDWAGTHLGYGFLQNFMDPALRAPYRDYWR